MFTNNPLLSFLQCRYSFFYLLERILYILHTLFYNKRILDRGCVGVALNLWPEAEVRPTFTGMRRVDGRTFSVTE